jgi:hypothetical protein
LAQAPSGALPVPTSESGPAIARAAIADASAEERYESLFSTQVRDLTVNIRPAGGALPDEVRLPHAPDAEAAAPDGMWTRGWAHSNYHWEATGQCHGPLYFEQVNLERYGYAPTRSRFGQSILSGAHFFSSVFILPYRLGAEPVYECQYTLGHYRPGSCVPYRFERPPLDWKGGALETVAIVGLIFAIP